MRTPSTKALVSTLFLFAGWLTLAAPPVVTGAWQIELADQKGTATSSSLRIDKYGNAHVVYVIDDGNRHPMRYATWDHKVKKWFAMTIAESVATCSLVLDSKQNPHVSYVDAGSGSGSKLRYMYWDGAAWKKIAIPLNADVIAYYSSIALDSNDQPSISFYEYRGPKDTDFKIRLRNVRLKDGYWQVSTVDSEEGSGKFNAMAVDSLGHMHISYANVSANTAGARYAYWDGTTWSPEVVEGLAQNNGEMVGYSSSIAVDKDGDPHISYVNESNPALRYAVRKDGHWQIQTITKMVKVGYPDRNAIALDEEGRAYISFYDAGRGTLNLAHQDGQKWVLETIDRGAGFASSMQINNHQIWISYGDEANSGLKVARFVLGPSDKKAVAPVAENDPVTPGIEAN